ncbi:M81 family metallopeptidase [Sinisalibacter lacisalsi]|uniref:Microcystinase C n=1 Tax=Sinisalibacter lacisalsi TaxID=1526570 RepID=A0ABQ1QRQ5_9RHOB|nr:M81 family metallopeptidase [Sinisalibacter lacisalsi]GGD40442.1 microcystinase C [Sinisalibacter lacisalsi]
MPSAKRVFVASIATETNTFSPMRTDLGDFRESFYAPPGEHPPTPTLCSAVFTAARARATELGWEVIEGTASWAEPGGIVNEQTWAFLRDQLLDELAQAGPVDIVLLGLHGAMVAQETIDCEGELLAAVRAQVGPDTLVGVTFDPHSHLSAKRVENADLITVFKEFPHTDFVEVAENLVQLAADASEGRTDPEISTFDCRMIEIFPTSRAPMRGFVDRIRAMEGQGNILSVSVIHGFMAGDVPDLGTKVIVITDAARAEGDALAQRLGMELFDMRGRTRPEFRAMAPALERAAAAPRGPVVIADVWDNPGGGVPGDSTTLLKGMIAQGLENAALASIWDPIAVRICFSAGEGARLRLRFGAKMAPGCGEPLDAEVTVHRCVRNAVQSFGASIVPIGDAVWIDVDGIDVILNSVRSQVFNPDIFANMGIDPLEKAVLAVKSTNHFHAAFEPIAAEILYVSIDGPYPNDPATNPYQRLSRDIWPRVENPHGT